MATDTSNTAMPDDDYDVIIIESGVGDPTIFASLQFVNGPNFPSKKSPLTDITIKANLIWPKRPRSIYVGTISIPSISTQNNYKFGIPYDDATFNIQKDKNIAVDMELIISAKNGDEWAKFKGWKQVGNAYSYVISGIIPQVYLDKNKDNNT